MPNDDRLVKSRLSFFSGNGAGRVVRCVDHLEVIPLPFKLREDGQTLSDGPRAYTLPHEAYFVMTTLFLLVTLALQAVLDLFLEWSFSDSGADPKL